MLIFTPKTGQKLLLVIIDGCIATDKMYLFAIPGIIKQLPWQLDFPYLHTVMALPERHTDVSIHGFIEISPNTKACQKIIILYFKNSKQGINS